MCPPILPHRDLRRIGGNYEGLLSEIKNMYESAENGGTEGEEDAQYSLYLLSPTPDYSIR